jgi:TPP-dependent pyruvate/acetoin dehydrogenase alpha subunit
MANLYRQMSRIRVFEQMTQSLKEAGEIPGSIHLSIGQEAIPVGFCHELAEDDMVSTTYRGHGWALAKGIPPAGIFAEMIGRDSSLNGGRGASLYFSSAAHNFLGENSIVGAGAPIATGAALSARNAGDGRVVVSTFGDGAMNQGVVLEALNIAVVMDLPVIFVIENNVYSEMTPIVDMMRGESLASRAAGFGIHSYVIDGNDPMAVIGAARDAIDRARSGRGPTFIEAKTVRLAGHYSGDAQQYRDPEELRVAWSDEPLVRLRQGADQATLDLYDSIDVEVASELQQSLEEAQRLPTPDPSTAKRHLYAE